MKELQRAETEKRSSARLRYFLAGFAILLVASAMCCVQTRQELASLKRHDSIVRSVAFSPDGKTLASGSVDHTVKLWDARTGQEVATLYGHVDMVYSVAFSQEVATLYGHVDMVYSVAFSPDGKTLASGGRDKTVKLWDAQTRKELARLYGHDDDVNSVAFSPDGKTLASGSRDKTVKLWVVDARQ